VVYEVPGHCWSWVYFEERPIFVKEDIILEHTQQLERKKHARGKPTWQGGRQA